VVKQLQTTHYLIHFCPTSLSRRHNISTNTDMIDRHVHASSGRAHACPICQGITPAWLCHSRAPAVFS